MKTVTRFVFLRRDRGRCHHAARRGKDADHAGRPDARRSRRQVDHRPEECLLCSRNQRVRLISIAKPQLKITATQFSFRLFAGIVPRVLWISIGGAIFLGVYDKALLMLS